MWGEEMRIVVRAQVGEIVGFQVGGHREWSEQRAPQHQLISAAASAAVSG